VSVPKRGIKKKAPHGRRKPKPKHRRGGRGKGRSSSRIHKGLSARTGR
jgi:hypothetical protein